VSDISGLSSVTGAAVPIPADVRAAGKDAETTYRAALGFERQLLEQLTKSMAKDMTGGTGDSDDESGESGASAATSAYNDMLPGTLADAVTNAGGLGLAHDLFLSMRSATS
jgi:Rod binding domain-containing protein